MVRRQFPWPRRRTAAGEPGGTSMACTFSAFGARWTVWGIAPGLNEEMRATRQLGAMTGLYFQAADGEERLLALAPADFNALGDLTSRSNQELAALAERAKVRT